MITALGPYWWLCRIAFLKLMAYRMRYITGIATYSVFIGVQYFVWKAVYAGSGQRRWRPHFEHLDYLYRGRLHGSCCVLQ